MEFTIASQSPPDTTSSADEYHQMTTLTYPYSVDFA